MAYSIGPSDDGRYIIHKFKGEINRRIAMEQGREAQALGRELGINRYLVDVTEARNTDTVMDSYEYAYSDMIDAEGIDKNSCFAILVSPGDHSHDFIETVMRNAGFNFRIFTDANQARLFLTGE